MVPLTAKLVVGHDHHRVLGAVRGVDRLQERDQVIAPPDLARVAGVLVLGPDRLDEADRVELAVLRRGLRQLDELLLVP